MNRWIKLSWCVCALTLVAFVALPGCNPGKPGAKTDPKTKSPTHAEHPTEGPHRGPLAEWGDDDYHAELTVDHDAKLVIVYVLDGTAKKAPDIAADKITKVKVTIVGATPAVSLELEHNKDKSGKDGIAFSGKHDFFGKKESFKAEISGLIDGKPYSDKDPVTYTPKKDKAASLRDLYLKPGGLYTEADIKANGRMTAGDKYKDKEWPHAEKKPGDKYCPVSKSKADAECTWVIQGQTYQFCCHPCIDKFVRYAHEEPARVKDSNTYVYKPM